jgi:hypothetical protein
VVQQCKIQIKIVNSDILHRFAFQEKAGSMACFHHAEIRSGMDFSSEQEGLTDLFLINMDSCSCCLKWLISGIQSACPAVPIVCYTNNPSGAAEKLGPPDDGVSVVSTDVNAG